MKPPSVDLKNMGVIAVDRQLVMPNLGHMLVTRLRLLCSRAVPLLFIHELNVGAPTLTAMALAICRPLGANRPSRRVQTPHIFPNCGFRPTVYDRGCMRTRSLDLSLLNRLKGLCFLWLTPPTKTTIGASCTW